MRPVLSFALIACGWVLGSLFPLRMPPTIEPKPIIVPFSSSVTGPVLPQGWACYRDSTKVGVGARKYRFEVRFDKNKAKKIMEDGAENWPQVTGATADSSYTVWVHSTDDADWDKLQPLVNGALVEIAKTAKR